MKKVFKTVSVCLMVMLATVALVGCENKNNLDDSENLNKFTIQLSVNNAESGSVYGGGKYYEGQTIILVAEAKEGYRFDSWSDGSTDAMRTLTVDSDKNLTANFEERWLYHKVGESIEVQFHKEDNDNADDNLWGIGIEKLKLTPIYNEEVSAFSYESDSNLVTMPLIYLNLSNLDGGTSVYRNVELLNQNGYAALVGGKCTSISFNLSLKLKAYGKDGYYMEEYCLDENITLTIDRNFTDTVEGGTWQQVGLHIFRDRLWEGSYLTIIFDIVSLWE